MRFTSAIFAAVALASSALAQTAGFAVMTSPTQDQEIPAGTSFDLIWTPGTPTGPVSIVLLQGETPATLQVGPTLASGIPSTLGKFTYAVPSTSAFKTYGFKITLDSDSTIFQYSFPFHISGATSSSSSASTTASASSTSSQVTGSTTSIPAPTSKPGNSTVTATVCTKCHHNGTSSATASTTASVSGNSTTLGTATTTGQGSTAAGGSATSASASTVTSNAAIANLASAGLALGGMFMAFAL